MEGGHFLIHMQKTGPKLAIFHGFLPSEEVADVLWYIYVSFYKKTEALTNIFVEKIVFNLTNIVKKLPFNRNSIWVQSKSKNAWFLRFL